MSLWLVLRGTFWILHILILILVLCRWWVQLRPLVRNRLMLLMLT